MGGIECCQNFKVEIRVAAIGFARFYARRFAVGGVDIDSAVTNDLGIEYFNIPHGSSVFGFDCKINMTPGQKLSDRNDYLCAKQKRL